MSRNALATGLVTFSLLWPISGLGAEAASRSSSPAAPRWRTAYGQAWKAAQQSGKMLLIWFRGAENPDLSAAVDRAFAEDAAVRSRLGDYVLLRVPVGATILSSGKKVRLLEHPAFAEMHGHEGLAILDLADKRRATFGRVVSAFPFMQGKYYRFHVGYLPVILSLPPGTITQRTMIWAVRVHPERPESTDGKQSEILAAEACQHCQYQAQICVQGHHRWSGRFQRIRRLLGGLFAPVEVVAESWPNQTLLDSCLDCVASWRQSSGHWGAVRRRHALYGYDIRRGRNGIWYGTGIFSGRWR